jgi:hypothetical protein
MRALLAAAAAVGITVSAASVGLSQGKPTSTPSVEGVWKRTSVVVTGANPSNTIPRTSVYIYTKRHYSHVFEGQPRKPLPPPKDPAKLTDAEKLARYEAWSPFTAHAGTYEMKGTTIIHSNLVNKNPPPETGIYPPASNVFENVKIEGNTMVRVAKSADGKSVTTTTYTRIE